MFRHTISAVGIALVAMHTSAAGYGEQANEELLMNGLRDLRENRLEDAAASLRKLTDQRPDFRVAQMIYGDLMMAHSQPLEQVGKQVNDDKLLKGFLHEVQMRVLHEQEKPGHDMLPAALLKLADNQQHVMVMDTRLSRLFLFRNNNGVPELIKDYYASYGRGGIGKRKQGDLKTPLGVYFITGRIPDSALPARYGSGALPINYPNVWDKRLKRTGNGIWLHGSPSASYTRPPLASEGCLSLSNPNFLEVDQIVDIVNTPFIIGQNIRWMPKADWLRQQAHFSAVVEQWRSDWESLEHDRYSAHYSPEFSDGKRRYKSFLRHKQRVNSSKDFIEVGLENLSLYRYPDQPGLMVASFTQHYRSSNYHGDSLKRQYWQFEHGQWKIVYEGKPSKGRR
ncbi:MAG: L,D-transpeptidase family protein [Marinobacterium sp.]|nr:L,D-transpeptidase family protein [Marinobacterium sp.]